MQKYTIQSIIRFQKARPLLLSVRTMKEYGPIVSAILGAPMEGQGKYEKQKDLIPLVEPNKKRIDEIFEPKSTGYDGELTLETDQDKEIMEIAGVPEEHREGRRARIYMPARSAMQSGWDNTGVWKIELDERERWENATIGWASNADPLSNISMALSFASCEDAINFCNKNRWSYIIEEAPKREIKPKAYGPNFSWSKRSRVSTK